MKLDWTFLARDLAAHLVAATDVEVTERILRDARRDAGPLAAPPEFWSRVVAEYENQAQTAGVEASDHVRAMLDSFRRDQRGSS